MQTVEVPFKGEEIASHTEGAQVYRLYRSHDDGALFVYWRDEERAWLESGRSGAGLKAWQVLALFPELAAGLE